MKTLNKRWDRYVYNSPYGLYKYILLDTTGDAWAEIRPTSKASKGCGWEIEVWDAVDGWGIVANVPTLRIARGTGRMLAGLSIQKYF